MQTEVFKILTREEFLRSYPTAFLHSFGSSHTPIRFCKAELVGNLIAGTLSVPDQKAPLSRKHAFGFCLNEDQLIFIDDNSFVQPLLSKIEAKQQLNGQEDPAKLFFDFLDFLIQDDMIFLQKYEEKLEKFEEQLEAENVRDSEQELLKIRRTLSIFGAYYEQLADMGESLQHFASEAGHNKNVKLYGFFVKKASRLHSMIRMLTEYSLQLREMHQTQIDLRQNRIMKVLTIVTTIFMPLTLITGWYGMNFQGMPELTAPHAYLIISLVCFAIVVFEIWLFWIKKWL